MSGKIGLFFVVQWAFEQFRGISIEIQSPDTSSCYVAFFLCWKCFWVLGEIKHLLRQRNEKFHEILDQMRWTGKTWINKNYLCLQVFIFISLFQRDTRDTIDDRQTLIQTTECSPERNWKNDIFSVKSVLFASHYCDCSVKWNFCELLATCGKLASKQRMTMRTKIRRNLIKNGVC